MDRREFVARGLGAGASLFVPMGLREHAQAPDQVLDQTKSDPYALVDPELLAAARLSPLTDWNDAMLADVRKHQPPPAATPPSIPGVYSTIRHIPGPTGAPEIRLVIADTAPDKRGKPALLHMHGGGYFVGNPEAFIPGVVRYAKPSGCLVVSVDYRLAPETRFPGALEDNYAALLWLYHHADELGVDPRRIAIAGESAGGGHAAALAIHARDKAEVPIVFQLLIYPMLDDRTGSNHPVPAPIGKIAWGAASNRFGWTALLGVPAGSAKVPYGSVPARVENLAGLPPAFIGVGAIDLFVDEDVLYAKRLIDAGVATELNVVPGAFHAFDLSVPNAQLSKRFCESIAVALQRAFGKSG